MLVLPLPALDDPEGDRIPESLPPVVDAHVHVFPDPLFEAIWQWFDNFAWPIRHRLGADGTVEFLLSRGVDRIVALHYAHRPGIARELNGFIAALCERYPRVTGTATVFPGEHHAAAILEDGFNLGLEGVKLHAHVQFFDMDGQEFRNICEICQANGKPLVMHVGREPKNPQYPYKRDPYELCSAKKLERILKKYPRLRLCVPHLGADEFDAYQRLIGDYDTLWLDIAMAIADYLPGAYPPPLTDFRADRIMYGSDFPNIPYAWDRELKRVCEAGLNEEDLALVLGRNALEFFSVSD